jgi:preprotein translocase SecE subunit
VDEKRGRRRRRQQEEDVQEIETVEDSAVEDGEEEEDDSEERGLTERKGRATPGRRSLSVEAAPSGNFVMRSLRTMRGYLDDVRSELSKVAWPTREEVTRLTRIVVGTVIASALVLGAISLIFTELFRIGLEAPVVLVIVLVIAVIGAGVAIRLSNNRTTGY